MRRTIQWLLLTAAGVGCCLPPSDAAVQAPL